ncbi:hypothetical protein ACQR3W_21945 [Rhodococcus ruber]|uniref:Uncharacterized protein n=1 Tax=Rhodococcus ruber TaxID=1830 RepID=A0A098BK04_9NOCA|nr:hypothetical protein [Rhodococcus ruber]MCZ4505912.1 hypothetical protein [Rhodococcus ruber]MCZ4533454.1 hypothetical protein [Rhodococcus ruber]CDZ89028.1 hypothetical protein RHRU231_450195 [Rhodococcus ruber]
MSNTPKFDREAFIAIASLVGNMIGVDIAKSAESIADSIESEVETGSVSASKRAARERFDDVQDALNTLGVDKPEYASTDDSDYHFHVANVDEAMRNFATLQKSRLNGGRGGTAHFHASDAKANVDVIVGAGGHDGPNKITSEAASASTPEPEGEQWEVAIRDREWGSIIDFRADRVDIGHGINGDDDGVIAYLNGDVVFQAPAGTYYYAKKVLDQ